MGRVEQQREAASSETSPTSEPGREPTLPEGLGRPHVPDSRHELLALQRLGEGQLGRPPQARDHRLDVRRLLQDVGPEPPDGAAAQLRTGPFH